MEYAYNKKKNKPIVVQVMLFDIDRNWSFF